MVLACMHGVMAALPHPLAAHAGAANVEKVFLDVNPDTGTTSIESRCMECGKNGMTKLMLTKIPHFREVVLSSFECPHCGNRNTGVESGAPLQEKGLSISLVVKSLEDISRQVIKSEHATLTIKELEFEIPSSTQRGVTSTVEGILSKAADDLEKEQPVRKSLDAAAAEKLQVIIDRVRKMSVAQEIPFTIVLDDPSGNSFLQNIKSEECDDQIVKRHYTRTREQLHAMGFYEEAPNTEEATAATQPEQIKPGAALPPHLRCNTWDLNKSVEENVAGNQQDEGIQFPVNCPHCGRLGSNNMCQIDIPGFRQCVIMAFVCENCGAKECEVKPSGPYGDQGKLWTLEVRDNADLNRDVLKSDMACVSIPEIDFEMSCSTVGGVFTTIEGLLTRMAEQLEKCKPFSIGDASCEPQDKQYATVVSHLRRVSSIPMLRFILKRTFAMPPMAQRLLSLCRGRDRLSLPGKLKRVYEMAHPPICL
eukprot:GHVT01097176.1.p1 GENE.GHVT01097176.1~~GHVT01097176.1.p1  ORF type:complete len:478 (-),score=67.14 GHVT01097176.1:1744-3177(-)